MPPRTQTQAADIEGSQVEHPTQVLPLGTPVEDDGTYTEPDPRNSEFRFTTEHIEKARREEREKVQKEKARLKAELDAQKTELDQFRQFKEQQEAERAAQVQADALAKRNKDEEELSAKDLLARREQEWQQKLAEQERKVQQQFAQLELEREATRLQGYIQRRVIEEQNARSLAPQFTDYITGSTVEEVEASIELAKAKTAQIMEEVAQQRASSGQARGVSVASGPSSMGSVTETDGGEVDYTTLSMKEYLEKVRPKLGIGNGGQGLFG